MRILWLLFVLPLLAGCLQGGTPDEGAAPSPAEATRFSAPLLVDALRAGSEPVIAVSPAGSIFIAAHPSMTLASAVPGATDPTGLAGYRGQGGVWRSTDGGETFHFLGLAGLPEGPRGAYGGAGDPDLVVTPEGAVCLTDLTALATAAVVCSADEGMTWVGNPNASGSPNDRQWLAALPGELYFTANFLPGGHIVRASTDGITWERRGVSPCPQSGPGGDFVGDAATGRLITSCNNGIAVSRDGGRTWAGPFLAGPSGIRSMAEPAVDGGGNVYVPYVSGGQFVVSGTPDDGASWPYRLDIGAVFASWREACTKCPGQTFWFPWVSAGSEGRLAVTFMASFQDAPVSSNEGPWFIFTVLVTGANTPEATFEVVQVTPEPVHTNPICDEGLGGCQRRWLAGDAGGDRRLGELIEATIDQDGMLHIAWTDTAAYPERLTGHVGYARQVAGAPLVVPTGSFAPTQG